MSDIESRDSASVRDSLISSDKNRKRLQDNLRLRIEGRKNSINQSIAIASISVGLGLVGLIGVDTFVDLKASADNNSETANSENAVRQVGDIVGALALAFAAGFGLDAVVRGQVSAALTTVLEQDKLAHELELAKR